MNVSDRALDFFFREGPAVFFTATPDFPWVIQSISGNVEAQLGYSVQSILNSPTLLWDSIHPEDREQSTKHVHILETKGSSEHLCRMRKTDGTYVLVQGEFRLLRDDKGAPEAVIGYWTDRTERERSRAILSAIPDSIFEVDREGRFTFYQTHRSLDLSRSTGMSLHDMMPKDVADLLLNAVQRALNTKETQTVKYVMPHGKTWRHYQANFGTSLSQDTAVAIIRDITDDVLHEKALSEQKRFLEEANVSLEQFVYIASHDLREPLIGVAGYATLLQKRYGTSLDETAHRFIEGITQGTRNMEAKIDDLLALSRVNRGNQMGSFPLGTAIDAAKRSLVGPLSTCAVEFKLPGVTPLLKGDRGQVTQVFQNLFSNSIKYRSPDKPVTIEISTKPDPQNPHMLIVSVTDNGIGFDPKHAERIFGVFQRLYTIQQYPGTGIGLAIVKKIVERHNGKVWATSQPGQGSTFSFTLPLAS